MISGKRNLRSVSYQVTDFLMFIAGQCSMVLQYKLSIKTTQLTGLKWS